MACVISSGEICFNKFRSREILLFFCNAINGKISPLRSCLAPVEMTHCSSALPRPVPGMLYSHPPAQLIHIKREINILARRPVDANGIYIPITNVHRRRFLLQSLPQDAA